MRYQEEKERILAEQRDREVAVFAQLQIDKELEMEERMSKKGNNHAVEITDEGEIRLPSYDRSSKPADYASNGGLVTPQVPDRSAKPASQGLNASHVS